jgi:hypothetical protein
VEELASSQMKRLLSLQASVVGTLANFKRSVPTKRKKKKAICSLSFSG